MVGKFSQISHIFLWAFVENSQKGRRKSAERTQKGEKKNKNFFGGRLVGGYRQKMGLSALVLFVGFLGGGA